MNAADTLERLLTAAEATPTDDGVFASEAVLARDAALLRAAPAMVSLLRAADEFLEDPGTIAYPRRKDQVRAALAAVNAALEEAVRS